MTAPDPLVCANLLATGQEPDCGEPKTSHCTSCFGCPNACVCPPLPAVGTQILPSEGLRTNDGFPVPHLPHTVVATHDHRHTGEPADHVIVAQLTEDVCYAAAMGQPVDTEQGAFLGLDDITVLDLPRITFTAKENDRG